MGHGRTTERGRGLRKRRSRKERQARREATSGVSDLYRKKK